MPTRKADGQSRSESTSGLNEAMKRAIAIPRAGPFLRLFSESWDKVLPLQAGTIARKSSEFRLQGQALTFSLPGQESGYVAHSGNSTDFSIAPPTLPMEIEAGRRLYLIVDPGESRLQEGCVLEVLIYSQGSLTHLFSIPLHVGRARRRIDMPQSGGGACFAVRLVGSGTLEPVEVHYTFAAQSGGESMPLEDVEPLSAWGRERYEEIRRRYDQPFVFDGVAREATGMVRPRSIYGLYRPSTEAMSRFYRPLRSDQSFPGEQQEETLGFVFDATVTDSFFGWEGCLTHRNNLSNMLLMKHLAVAKARKIPTILVFDQASRIKPFFEDFAPQFRFQVEKEADDMDRKVMALCGIGAS